MKLRLFHFLLAVAKFYHDYCFYLLSLKEHLNVCAKYPVECLNACGEVISREKVRSQV